LPRRQQTQSDSYTSAETKAHRLLDSPLSQVGKKLLDVLSEAKQNSPEPLGDYRLARLANYVAHVADRLPQSFGERFHFDSALIGGITRDWGKKVTVSGMIVPRHGEEWGHERIMMPSEDAQSAHFIDLVLLPRHDRREDVDLLSYPLIIHEMNHYAFLRYETLFIPAFKSGLEEIVRKLRLAAISDRPLEHEHKSTSMSWRNFGPLGQTKKTGHMSSLSTLLHCGCVVRHTWRAFTIWWKILIPTKSRQPIRPVRSELRR
jgi:hypothetical protein